MLMAWWDSILFCKKKIKCSVEELCERESQSPPPGFQIIKYHIVFCILYFVFFVFCILIFLYLYHTAFCLAGKCDTGIFVIQKAKFWIVFLFILKVCLSLVEKLIWVCDIDLQKVQAANGKKTWRQKTKFIPSYSRFFPGFIPGLFQVYSRFIPGFFSSLFQVYSRFIPGLFQVFFKFIPGLFQVLFQVYSRFIPCLFQFFFKFISGLFQVNSRFIPGGNSGDQLQRKHEMETWIFTTLQIKNQKLTDSDLEIWVCLSDSPSHFFN